MSTRIFVSKARDRAPGAHHDPGRRQECDSQLATVQNLARYWATDYDWRKCEAKLTALPHFITKIDGLDIHFIHARSKHDEALPLIVTHGARGARGAQIVAVGRGGCIAG
jgi:hypothetical protein